MHEVRMCLAALARQTIWNKKTMSTKKENIVIGRKTRPHHSPAKRTRHNQKIALRRALLEEEPS
jgi:hypothetical protein